MVSMVEQQGQNVGEENVIHYYFVDEAGDLTLFGRRGSVLVGTPGCSRCFMLGVALLPDPAGVEVALHSLRERLLADPYFKGVPSMLPEKGKTALHFHAKDDLPEVRREVFRLLPTFGAKVQVALRRKTTMVEQARRSHSRGRRLSSNEVYDDLAKRLFKNLLHKPDENRIVFARRGKRTRSAALEQAIAKAKANFERTWGRPSNKPTTIRSEFSHASAGLQVIDYYLWSLQRLFERGESRFFELLRDDYRLIMYLDDKRNKRYGEWYNDSNPLDPRKTMTF